MVERWFYLVEINGTDADMLKAAKTLKILFMKSEYESKIYGIERYKGKEYLAVETGDDELLEFFLPKSRKFLEWGNEDDSYINEKEVVALKPAELKKKYPSFAVVKSIKQ